MASEKAGGARKIVKLIGRSLGYVCHDQRFSKTRLRS